MKFWVSMLFFFITVPTVLFAQSVDFDAGVRPGSITFSTDRLYAGEPVRIYGNLVNLGAKDISGAVGFFAGTTQLGSQFFSLKAQSASEDFWVDWTPIEGTYNISMTIILTTPDDQNFSNNTAVTALLSVGKRPLPPPPIQPQPQPQQAQQSVQSQAPLPSPPQVIQFQKVVQVPKKTTPSVIVKAPSKTTISRKQADTRVKIKSTTPEATQNRESVQDVSDDQGVESQDVQSILPAEGPFREERKIPLPRATPSLPLGLLIVTGLAAFCLGGGCAFWYLSSKKE